MLDDPPLERHYGHKKLVKDPKDLSCCEENCVVIRICCFDLKPAVRLVFLVGLIWLWSVCVCLKVCWQLHDGSGIEPFLNHLF